MPSKAVNAHRSAADTDHMPTETKLLLTCLVILAAGLVYAVLRVSGAWYEHHVSRHDLVAESKRRRFAYLKAIADRDREMMEAQGAVIIENDEPQLAQAA